MSIASHILAVKRLQFAEAQPGQIAEVPRCSGYLTYTNSGVGEMEASVQSWLRSVLYYINSTPY